MIARITIAAALAFPQDFEVLPVTLLEEPSGATSYFDPRWTLPEECRDGRDLLAEMRRLAVLSLQVDLGEGRTANCFGDLVAAVGELDDAQQIAWVAGLAELAPRLHADWGAGLSELLLDNRLRSDSWDPRRDHPRDGLLIADDWKLGDEYGPPWTELKVDARFVQAAALFQADLVTIKEVENDYRLYPENVGASYEEIFPIRERYFQGEGANGSPFSVLAIQFRCDLPFPFSDYTCRLNILNRVDEQGIARTDIYSTSPDFHFLAGRDVFLPVLDSGGEQVAFLVVRHFGFDLDGIPDKRAHRLEALRTSLGNLKRNSEARFRAENSDFGALVDGINGFRVIGTD